MTTQPKVLELTEEQKAYAGRSLFQLAMRRLRRDNLTLIAITFLAVIAVLSLLAPFISGTLLQRNATRTDLPNVFVPPGAQERLISRTDSSPYRVSNLYVVVAIGLEGGQPGTKDVLISDIADPTQGIPIKTLKDNNDNALVYFVHGAPRTPADRPVVDVYINGKLSVQKLRYERVSDALKLAPGKYDIAVRGYDADGNAPKPDAAPLASANGIEFAPGKLTTLVLSGQAGVTGEFAPAVKAYTVDATGLQDGKFRTLLIHAVADVSAVRASFNTNVQADNIKFRDSAQIDYDPGVYVFSASDVNARTFVLGSDDLGRDQLSRLLYGGQVSLSIAFLAAIISISIGVTLGIITGFYGGVIDDFTNLVITTLSSIPTLILLLIIVAVLRPTMWTLILVLGLLGWISTARLVRGETLSIRAREYIVSARSIGAPISRIMFVHILPNLLSTVLITLALDIGGLILTEAALSFLGYGVDPSQASWGNMLTNAQTFFTKGPYLVIYPGLLISATVLCLYIIGDGLRDAFDPTAKN